jgi:hypothetical protein
MLPVLSSFFFFPSEQCSIDCLDVVSHGQALLLRYGTAQKRTTADTCTKAMSFEPYIVCVTCVPRVGAAMAQWGTTCMHL